MSRFAAVFKLGGMALFFGICAMLLLLSLPQSGWKALSVQTGSMKPAIDTGDMVLVHHVPASDLQIGDVITYINPTNKKQTITHRLVAINGPQLIVKGDANRSADAPVSAPSVIGKVSYSLPHVGNALNFTRKPLGMWTLLAVGVYLPALLIMISEIKKLNRYYRIADPYVSAKIRQRGKGSRPNPKYALAAKATMFLIVLSGIVFVPVAYAALTSTATLTGNTISSAAITPPNQCTGNNTNVNVSGSGGNNSNTVIVNNSSSQSSSTGNATNSGNTNGGNATSGNASNSNNTCININITNH